MVNGTHYSNPQLLQPSTCMQYMKLYYKKFLSQTSTQLCITTLAAIIRSLYITNQCGEGDGSVVKRQTPEREVWGSKPTPAVLCP